MSAPTSAPQVTNRGPGWQELTRTGHWRELVGWVRKFDVEGRLLAPAQVAEQVGNQVTVRVRVRVIPEQRREPSAGRRRPPQGQPAEAPSGRRTQVGTFFWEWAAVAAVVVGLAGGLMWVLWSATELVFGLVVAHHELLVGAFTVAFGIAVGIWLAHRRR